MREPSSSRMCGLQLQDSLVVAGWAYAGGGLEFGSTRLR